MSEDNVSIPRRALLVLGGALVASSCGGAQHGSEPGTHEARGEHGEHGERGERGERGEHEAREAHEEDIGAVEDLMREHGVIRRTLLVYSEAARRLRAGESVDPTVLTRGARLIRTFAEDYHERAEEQRVFPVLERVPAQAPLVAVLRAQHERGRALTDEVQRLAGGGGAAAANARLAGVLEGFVRMYEAHAAFEDTVAFVALRRALSPHALHELGEAMEAAEHATVGEGGFERAVAEVGELALALGVNDLARYTPAAAG